MSGVVISLGKGGQREVHDYKLSGYACYLIAQNGDSRKKSVALAQTYFAVQTRKMELTERDYSSLTEEEKRFYQRNLTKKGNYSLNQTVRKAGVKNLIWVVKNLRLIFLELPKLKQIKLTIILVKKLER